MAAACGGSEGGSPSVNGDAGAVGADDGGGGATEGGSPDASTQDGGKPGSGTDGASPGPEGGASGDGGPGPTLPSPTGACPTIQNGDVTFAPAGIPARAVTLSMTAAAAQLHGPLVFYWHGTGSAPAEASYALGATLAAIEAAGGIVAAPYHDANAGQFPWYLVSGTKDDDLRVADEVLACVAKQVGIDARHVHSMGFSAGALHTTFMSYARSSYLASVVTFSGGLPQGVKPTSQDPANLFAALVFDGGTSDNVFNFDFQAASLLYKTTLVGAGHFAAICDHNMGHAIPTGAAPSVWAFFQANGFGVSPSPYAGGLPAGFPSYCSL
ncbi:MAG TPA: hypothetical protein VIF15_07730 [Polyangiaceae bacterium]